MIELLRTRRSIRKYTREPVDRQSVELLLEAALRAPSSRNRKPWEFVVVDDPGLMAGLATSKAHGSGFLKDAPLAIVVCADGSRSDIWIEDCAIAAILVQLTAASLGLGSCWSQIRSRPHDEEGATAEAFVRELLGLPEEIRVATIIGIGHPDETIAPVSASDLDYHKVRHDRYAEAFER
jgi:nitroreductase